MTRRSLVGALGVVFVSGGVAKLAGVGPASALGDRLGLSNRLLAFIGCCELAGGLGLLAGLAVDDRLGTAAGAGLSLLTLSGAVAHVRAGESPAQCAPALLLGGASVAATMGFRRSSLAH